MGQLSMEGSLLRAELERHGYSLVKHQIGEEQVDALINAYAYFTDNLPDPEPETLARMIIDPDNLDQLDRAQDRQREWHKYRTNHPQFAKPGGYTNRSAQVAALRLTGRDRTTDGQPLTDDPKEYYHFQPNGLARISQQHELYGWGAVPPEVTTLHVRFTAIHRLAREAIVHTYRLLEEDHPELINRFARPSDLDGSPLRLLFYHPDGGEVLAEEHVDKSSATIQLAESHVGLRIRDPETGVMQLVRRDSSQAVFFPSYQWPRMYPDSELIPGRHDVVKDNELNNGRQLRGLNCARWAIIFFANTPRLEQPTKADTHIAAAAEPEILQDAS